MYKDQTSDLIFEKVLNEDRSISRDPVVAFVEQNGNFYYQPPLMSLARRYHKTDDYGHSQLIKQFTDVLQNYSIDESDDLLTALNVESDNPRLLIILKNKIDAFTNKSPATTTGRLYTQMASNIVLADTLISKQEMVTKRQFTNGKIQDFRNVLLPNLQKKESNAVIYSLPGFGNSAAFLPKPLVSRSLAAIHSVDSDLLIDLTAYIPDLSKYFKLETSAYYFFDYEKALNYKSEISKFLNPYNIEQIFGKGSLANYFKFNNCTATKTPLKFGEIDQLRQKRYVLRYFDNSIDQIDFEPEVNFHSFEGSTGKVQSVTAAGMDLLFLKFSATDNQKFYSTLMQRGFDTLAQLNDYRLSLFELKDYQKSNVNDSDSTVITEGLESIRLSFEISIDDSTMEFYDTHIRKKIFALLNNVEKYYNHASDFCSFNNLDGKFNDFFLKNIREQFSEPYPWIEAPFYYYAFLQMIEASRNSTGGRKRSGVLIDLESVRQVSIDKKYSISPETGDFQSLEDFYNDLRSLVQDYFTKDSGLDKSNEIYLNNDAAGEGYYLVSRMVNLNFDRKDDFRQSMIASELPIEEIENRVREEAVARSEALEDVTEQKALQCRLYKTNFAEKYEQALTKAALRGESRNLFNITSEDARNLLRIAGNYNDDQCGDLIEERIHPDIEAIRNFWEDRV
jgi:hypothetical protein